MTGSGKLLSYLTHRSIQIALLPKPGMVDMARLEEEQKRMQDFTKQLPDVEVQVVADGGIDRSHGHPRKAVRVAGDR